MAIRNYTNIAPPVGLSPPGVGANDPVLTVGSTANYPAPPFLLAIERGTEKEELCLCTAKTTTTFTVTRGFDGTERIGHDPGAVVEHSVAAIDYREANEHVNNTGSEHTFVGQMEVSARTDLPAGRLWCRGDWVAKATYNALWLAIGDTWLDGAAARPDEFRLPNMQGFFPWGMPASGLGAALGSKGGAYDAVVAYHSHTSGSNSNATGDAGNHDHAIPTIGALTGTSGSHSHSTTGGAGGHWHYSSGSGEAVQVIKVSTAPWNTGSHAGDGASTENYVTFDYGHTVKTSTGGGHDHSTDDPGNHRHSINAGGTHSHAVGFAGTNGNVTNANMPPWKSVNWVIKY